MASMALAVPGVSVAKDRHEGNPPRKHRMTMRHLPAKESKGIHRMVEAGDVTARKADKKRVSSPERLLGNGVELYGWLGYSEENVLKVSMSSPRRDTRCVGKIPNSLLWERAGR